MNKHKIQTDEIIIFFLYLNNNNELYNITKKKEIITDGIFSQERQLHIIKENQCNNLQFHQLIATSYFNFDINKEDLHKIFDTNNENNENNFYKTLNIVDTIIFNKTILKSINSVFYIYKNYISQSTTKKIILQPKKQTKKLSFINVKDN